jgi:hypothetical protein
MVGACEGRAEGRRFVVAVTDIGAAGAASLAPSLLRMTLLTSLNLSCTLQHRLGLRCERAVANAGCAWMLMDAVG